MGARGSNPRSQRCGSVLPGVAGVLVDVSGDPFVDFEKEAFGMMNVD